MRPRREAAGYASDVPNPLPVRAAGEGPPLLLVPGFALGPRAYARTTDALAQAFRVLVPDPFAVIDAWSSDVLARRLADTLEIHGAERVTLLAHSFGCGVALGFAARHPERLLEAVWVDSVGLADRAALLGGVLSGFSVRRLASREGYADFASTLLRHPRRVARAGWWAWSTADREVDVAAVRAADFPNHVLWAERDTLLAREDGRRFADRLGASFALVVDPTGGGPVDHGWLLRRPHLALPVLHALGVKALAGRPPPDFGACLRPA